MLRIIVPIIIAMISGIGILLKVDGLITAIAQPYAAITLLIAMFSIFMLWFHLCSKKVESRKSISCFIALFMFIIPPFGIWGYRIFIKMYTVYMGGYLTFEYPLFVWCLGIFAFIVGILISGIFGKKDYRIDFASYYDWDRHRLKMCLLIFTVIALGCTVLAVSKIGYIPIFKQNINLERFSYSQSVGGSIVKFSRLWLLVVLISGMLWLLEKKNSYFVLVIVGVLGLLVYGQRQFALISLASVILLRNKVCRIKKLTIMIVLITTILLYSVIAGLRGSDSLAGTAVNSLTRVEKVVYHTFGEWREYSFIVNAFHDGIEKFVGWRFLNGSLAALVPKEIFLLAGKNKLKYLDDNPAAYLGRYFGHYAGIRIGIIGECYASFNLSGVFIIMCLIGVVAGYLEDLFMRNRFDVPFFLFVVLMLANVMFLPLSTFVNYTNMVGFYGVLLLLTIWFCSGRKLS